MIDPSRFTVKIADPSKCATGFSGSARETREQRPDSPTCAAVDARLIERRTTMAAETFAAVMLRIMLVVPLTAAPVMLPAIVLETAVAVRIEPAAALPCTYRPMERTVETVAIIAAAASSLVYALPSTSHPVRLTVPESIRPTLRAIVAIALAALCIIFPADRVDAAAALMLPALTIFAALVKLSVADTSPANIRERLRRIVADTTTEPETVFPKYRSRVTVPATLANAAARVFVYAFPRIDNPETPSVSVMFRAVLRTVEAAALTTADRTRPTESTTLAAAAVVAEKYLLADLAAVPDTAALVVIVSRFVDLQTSSIPELIHSLFCVIVFTKVAPRETSPETLTASEIIFPTDRTARPLTALNADAKPRALARTVCAVALIVSVKYRPVESSRETAAETLAETVFAVSAPPDSAVCAY